MLAEAPHDVSCVDDGVVDHGSEGDQQPRDDHHIDRHSTHVEHGPCDHHRQENDDGADQRGTPVGEECKERHQHEDGPDEQRPAQVADRQVEEGRGPKEGGVHLQARETRPQRRKRLFQFLRHRVRIGPGEFLDHEHERGSALHDGITDERLMVFHHRGDVTQTLRFGVVDRHLGQVFRRRDGQDVPDAEPLIRSLDPPAGTRGRRFQKAQRRRPQSVAGGFDDLHERHAFGSQLVRIHLHLQLPLTPAPDRHVRHAGHTQQAGLDRPAGEH